MIIDHTIITVVIMQGVDPNWRCVPSNEGPWFLEELTSLAKATRAKFNIAKWEVNTLWGRIEDRLLQQVAGQIETQDEEPCLCLGELTFETPLDSERNKIFLTLAKKAKEWKIKLLSMDFHTDQTWLNFTALGLMNNGHIDFLFFFIDPQRVRMLEELKRMKKLDELKGVWDKAAKFSVYNSAGHPLQVGGGRGDNPVTDWQRVLNFVSS